MSNIERRFREIDETRGRGSEQLVSTVLEMMVEEREIDNFERIEPHSGLNHKGIDFFVTIREKRFPLQVKSSRSGLKTAREKHPGIPVIRVQPGDPTEEVRQRIKSALGKERKKYPREKSQ